MKDRTADVLYDLLWKREIWVQDFSRGTERRLEDLSVDAATLNSIKSGIEVRRLDVCVQVRVRCQSVVAVVLEFSVGGEIVDM